MAYVRCGGMDASQSNGGVTMSKQIAQQDQIIMPNSITITFQIVRKSNHSLVAEFATRAQAVEFVEVNGLNKDELLLIQTSLDSWE